ncbi:hypothetical protein P3T23_001417 [Paraburkholderia sp. GAS448]|uniref:hypothetical protein n=1 Tax=Paraburkholderia sp. GAS448 TaxID=3035136 RepID=UPI003D23F83C
MGLTSNPALRTALSRCQSGQVRCRHEKDEIALLWGIESQALLNGKILLCEENLLRLPVVYLLACGVACNWFRVSVEIMVSRIEDIE